MATTYVTLVGFGGTPVRLADQTGAPFPTTGTGALVFANGATLTNVTITGQVIPTPTALGPGSVTNPALTFGSFDRGIFSQGAGDVSVASNGTLMASFEPNASVVNFASNAVQLSMFSDGASEVSLQGYVSGTGTTRQLTLQKYGSQVVIGSAFSPQAGGSTGGGVLGLTSSRVLVTTGTGAPTLSGPYGSLYMRNDSTALPYYNNSNSTTWVQLADVSTAQTLTNKTLGSGTVISNITGLTVAQGALTANTPVSFTQTWNNGGVNFQSVLINSTKTAEAGGSKLLDVQLGGSERFSIDQFGTGIFNGAAFLGGNVSIETGTAPTAGGAQDFGFLVSSTAHFGHVFGTGAPSGLTQAAGTIYSANSNNTPPYYNLTGGTTWDQLAGLAATNAFTGSNSFTVSPTAPTVSANDNSTKAATTAYADRVLANLVINVQVFTSSGTYTPHANMVYAVIECWGAGGGGGGTASAAATINSSGGGGGGGSYSRKTVAAATIGASQTVTIGVAGSAGTAGNNAGGNGGDTSVGVICVGKGGTGGAGNNGTNNNISAGGLGGVAGTGDITTTGANGFSSVSALAGSNLVVTGGSGASSPLGGGGRSSATLTATNGEAATGHAAGGAGGMSFNAGGTAAGGAGTAGYIVITEYCTH
jgi:hypothetical protein